MADPFIGEIRAFAFTYCPENWAICNGQLLQISQYSTLYSVIGPQYGGDARNTFALPKLGGDSSTGYIGYALMGTGTGNGLTTRQIAKTYGEASVTLNVQMTPYHTHTVDCYINGVSTDLVDTPDTTTYLSRTQKQKDFGKVSPTIAMAPGTISTFPGSNQPHENMQPYLLMNFCICLEGIYPIRP